MTKPTFHQLLDGAKVLAGKGRGAVNCTYTLAANDKPYPRTCQRCGLGPCAFEEFLLKASREQKEAPEVVLVKKWQAADSYYPMGKDESQAVHRLAKWLIKAGAVQSE